jgi:hypothetical protein
MSGFAATSEDEHMIEIIERGGGDWERRPQQRAAKARSSP